MFIVNDYPPAFLDQRDPWLPSETRKGTNHIFRASQRIKEPNSQNKKILVIGRSVSTAIDVKWYKTSLPSEFYEAILVSFVSGIRTQKLIQPNQTYEIKTTAAVTSLLNSHKQLQQ